MPAIQVKPDIYWIGVNDRTTDLFEGVWPITQGGVSYNSYLVMGEKKALIDMAAGHHAAAFIDQVRDLIDPAELDYIVVNHMEPDHTGAAELLGRLATKAEFLVSAKAAPMMASYYGLTEGIRVVKDGETVDLGGLTLQFHMVPFVHWPETMVTYVPEHKVLFSCDAFGGYGALLGRVFDDQCVDMAFYTRESLRYYTNIVARFSGPVSRAIEKLKPLEIDVVAPSHGLVWRKNPRYIIDLYGRWAQLATQPADPGVTLVYGSMYGNTERMMNAVAEGVSRTQLPLEVFDGTGGADLFGADFRAVQFGAAAVASVENPGHPFFPKAVPAVGKQGEGPVDGGRAAVVGVVVHHAAAGHAAAAGDALGGQSDVLSLLGIRANDGRFVGGNGRMEIGHRLFVFLEERFHVHHQVLDDRKVVQGADGDFLFRQIRHHGFARQPLPAVDDHRAGAAHAHPAGVPKREARVLFCLDFEQNVENGGQGFVGKAHLKTVEITRRVGCRIVPEDMDDFGLFGFTRHRLICSFVSWVSDRC